MRESHARPRPVHRVCDQPRAHWIAEHVAEDCEEMAVLLNRKTLEAALPHMAVTVVVPMVAADVAGHPPLHERAQGRNSRGLHDQMEMIGHQAEAEDLDGMPGFGSGEQVKKGGVVAVLMEDRGATVPTIQHMVGVPSDLSARNPRHGKTTVRQTGVGTQVKVACPLFLSPFSFPRLELRRCPVRASAMGRHCKWEEFFDEWASGTGVMTRGKRKWDRREEKGTGYFSEDFRGRPRWRRVDSRPKVVAITACSPRGEATGQSAVPKGCCRFTQVRSAVSS
jgi:hypothetical protein